MTHQRRYDVVVVGAGILGLAHAYHAFDRGLSVAVIDHADRVAGASVQNFGHVCITAQSGVARDYALAGREHWLDLSRKVGFWISESGTYCVARRDDEMAVLTEFADRRGPVEVELLPRDRILAALPVSGSRVVGGMYMSGDLQVDPREAAPAVARWLEASGVDYFWRTAATGFDPGVVHTSRGDLRAGTVFVTVNHDIDRLFPERAERRGLLRCRLHMLRARMPLPAPLPAPLFTGWSLVRYRGFADLPATAALAARLREEHPDYADLDLHQMYTPQPDGSILLGDTHIRDVSAEPFQSERGFEVLIREAAALFGVPDVTVTERWQGVYGSAPDSEFLIEEPVDGVHVVTVTTGIGMTTGMGLAKDRIDHVFGRESAPAI